VIFDHLHKKLLEDSWLWNGTTYIRDFGPEEAGASLMLCPAKIKEGSHTAAVVDYERRHSWDLNIHVHNGEPEKSHRVKVCTYRNFFSAAHAVLGNGKIRT
jgi:hypothetical protein